SCFFRKNRRGDNYPDTGGPFPSLSVTSNPRPKGGPMLGSWIPDGGCKHGVSHALAQTGSDDFEEEAGMKNLQVTQNSHP
ncbi:hypothetical protein, partial [Pseudomonas syringae]|uniref:hypothetical protein n=1 Tax=Pseudomonas syringae TaxID=317 RepID=UPI001A7E0469